MKENLIAQYFEERQGIKTKEFPFGFFMYRVEDGLLRVTEFYITPAERGKGLGQELGGIVFETAAELGCDAVLGSVDPRVKTDNYSLKCYLEFGFQMLMFEDNLLYLIKPVKQEIN